MSKSNLQKKSYMIISAAVLHTLLLFWLLFLTKDRNINSIEAEAIFDSNHQIEISELSQGSPWLIPAAAFLDWGTGWSVFMADDGYVTATNDVGACVMAPVYLPDNVLIQSFRVYAYDNHPYQNITINFRRKAIGSISSAELIISPITTTINSSDVQQLENTAINPALARVDNSNYSYYVDVCLFTYNRLYAVEIAFITKTYLPVAMNNYISYFDGPWEKEPNNADYEANGAIHSDQDYFGYPNDTKDYFYFTSTAEGQITLDLTNHAFDGAQLQLFYGSALEENRVGFDATPPLHIDLANQPAGTYYVYIATESVPVVQTPYTLRVDYPTDP